MKKNISEPVQQPLIVKFVETDRRGIQSQSLDRYAIGCVICGTKYIYEGEQRQTLTRGDIYYMGIGHHYVEHIPDADQPYREIRYYYTPADLQRILLHLSVACRMEITDNCPPDANPGQGHIVMPGWNAVRDLFFDTDNYLRDEDFVRDETAESLKMTELIYRIVAHEDCSLRSKILSNADTAKESFEQTMFEHIFHDISIDRLARQTNRSLTSFKKEFQRHFQMPPHRWFIRQRLMHARLLLLSTSKSIAEIGTECSFPNTSHFIKLFKKEFHTTPASYRHHQSLGSDSHPAGNKPVGEAM